MKTHFLLPCFSAILVQQLALTVMPAADTSADPKSPELVAKLNEAAVAEAESRIQKALKEIADARKAADNASNPDLLRAEQEKAKAEAEKAAAEAEKARFAATLPPVATKPLDGKVDIDDKAGYYSQILAHESAIEAAMKVADRVATKVDGVNIIYLVKQPDYLRGGLQLTEIDKRLDLFENAFNALDSRYRLVNGAFTINEASPLVALSAIPAAIGAVADVAALFRVDRNIKGKETGVTDDSMLAAVAGALRKNTTTAGIAVIRPGLNTTPNPGILIRVQTLRTKSELIALRVASMRSALIGIGTQIEKVERKISTAQAKVTALDTGAAAERSAIRDEIKRLNDLFEKTDKPDERTRLGNAVAAQKADLVSLATRTQTAAEGFAKEIADAQEALIGPKDQKAQGEFAVQQLENLVKAYSAFCDKLMTVPDGATASPLTQLAEIAMLRGAAATARILTVSVNGQGGEVETRKSIWTSGKVYHRAGVACAFSLFLANGEVTEAGLVVASRQTLDAKLVR